MEKLSLDEFEEIAAAAHVTAIGRSITPQSWQPAFYIMSTSKLHVNISLVQWRGR